MRQEWSPEELVANKSGPTRLGFALLLKFFELEGRFPDLLEEVPQAAVEYVAGLVQLPRAADRAAGPDRAHRGRGLRPRGEGAVRPDGTPGGCWWWRTGTAPTP